MRKVRFFAVLALLALAIGAWASFASAATRNVTVRRSGTSFFWTPKTLTVSVGDTVRWSWGGNIPHNVTAPGFKSRTATRLTYRRRMNTRGTVTVRCTLHARTQVMKIRVR